MLAIMKTIVSVMCLLLCFGSCSGNKKSESKVEEFSLEELQAEAGKKISH